MNTSNRAPAHRSTHPRRSDFLLGPCVRLADALPLAQAAMRQFEELTQEIDRQMAAWAASSPLGAPPPTLRSLQATQAALAEYHTALLDLLLDDLEERVRRLKEAPCGA